MRERVRRAAVAVAPVCAVSACDEQLSDVAGPTPNLTPTFSSIQRDIPLLTPGQMQILRRWSANGAPND